MQQYSQVGIAHACQPDGTPARPWTKGYVRDIASMVSSASSGNNALKLSFSADYTFSKLLTMSFYYDRQSNTPLLSSSSYPTTTQDFGLSIKFSLTR